MREKEVGSRKKEMPPLEEMTLVEFVVLLLQQWKAMLGCVAFIMVLTLLAIWLKPVQYSFSTLYAVASYETSEGDRVGVEMPEEVIAKVDNIFIHERYHQLLHDESIQGIPFSTRVTRLGDTLLLHIVSDSSPEDQSLVERFHDGLLTLVMEDQQQRVENMKASLAAQVQAYTQTLSTLRESGENTLEQEAFLLEQMFQFEQRIESVYPGGFTQLATQSAHPVGIGKTFLLAFGLVLALLLAPLAAVLSVFVKNVAVAYRRAR